MQFDDGKTEYEGELSLPKLQNFITVQSLPLIVDFNAETSQKIFSGEIKNHLLVFLSKSAGHFDKYVEGIKEPAKNFRGEVNSIV